MKDANRENVIPSATCTEWTCEMKLLKPSSFLALTLTFCMTIYTGCSGGSSGDTNEAKPQEEEPPAGSVKSSGNPSSSSSSGGRPSIVSPIGTLAKTAASTTTKIASSTSVATEKKTNSEVEYVSDPIKSSIFYDGPAILISGVPVTLVFKGIGASGTPVSKGGEQISFYVVSGAGSGEFGPVSDQGDGTYIGTFTPQKMGNSVILSAKINENPIQMFLPPLAIVSGAIDPAKTALTLSSGLDTVTAGSETSLFLVTFDAFDNPMTQGGAEIALSLTGEGTSSGVFGPIIDLGNGTYSSTFLARKSGSPKFLTAFVNQEQIETPLPQIKVTAGPLNLAYSDVNTVDSIFASGTSTSVSLTLKDDFNNVISDGLKNVSFDTFGSGTSTVAFGATTYIGNGVYQASMTGVLAGTTKNIRAVVDGQPTTSSSPTVQVTPGALSLSQSTLSINGGITSLSSGSTVSITLTTRDTLGNILTTGGLGVNFATTSDGTSTGTFGAIVDHGNGTYSTTFTGNVAGSAVSLVGKIDGNPITSPLPQLIVTPGGIDLAQSHSSLSSASINAGSSATLHIILRDASGNQLNSGGHTVEVNLNNNGTSTAQIGSVTDSGNGSYTVLLTGNISGTPSSILVRVNENLLTSAAPTLQVNPGPLSLVNSSISISQSILASGTSTTVNLTLKDTFDNVISDGLKNVSFESFGSGSSTFSIGATSYIGDGTYQAIITGALAGTAKSIRAIIDGQPTTSSSPTVQVTPGAVSLSQSTLAINGGITILSSGSGVTITLTARDGHGNLLTSGGLSVSFSIASGGTSSGTFGSTVDHTNGTYSTTFTGQIAGSAVSLVGRVGGNPITSPLPQITVIPGAYSLSQSTVTISDGFSTVVSGEQVTAILTARDAQGNQLTSGGLNVAFIKNGGSSTVTFGTVTSHGNGTYSVPVTGILKGTASNIVGRIGGVSLTSLPPQLTVTQGPLSLFASTTAPSIGTLAAGQTSDLIFTARDANGNVFSTGGLDVEFTVNGPSDGVVGSVTDLGNGTYTAVFTATTAGAASVILTTVGGSSVTSTSPTIIVTPGAFDPDLSTATLANSVIQAGQSTLLTVTLFDSYGNQLQAGGHTVACSVENDGSSTANFGTASYQGNGIYQLTLTGQISGTAASLLVSVNGLPLTSNTNSLTVLTGPISPNTSTLSIESTSLVSGMTYWVRLTAKDAAQNLLTVGGSTVLFSYSGGSSSGTFSAVADAGDGTYSAVFTAVTAGSPTTLSATIDGVSVTSSAPSFMVNPSSSTIISLLGIPSQVVAGNVQNLTVTLLDLNNNIVNDFEGSISITTDDPQNILTPATYTFTRADKGTKDFAITFRTAGLKSVNATDMANPLIQSSISGITVLPAAASHIAFAGASEAKVKVCSPSLTLQIQDVYGNESATMSTLNVSLSGQGNGSFFSDPSCNNAVSTLSMGTGTSSSQLFFKSEFPENLSIQASAEGLIGIYKNFSVKPYQAWLGSLGTSNVFATGGHAIRGRFDGMLNGPLATAFDQQGRIYIADTSNHRIQKYDPTYGFEGWIGRVSITPTGGVAGCEAAVGVTPGWCSGGFASSGGGDGQMNSPGGIAIAEPYLYVADTSNHRILRFDLESGAFAGWSGRILTSPTGGSAGCAGAAIGTTTPGWCFGGTSQSGSGMGQFNLPRDLLIEGDHLYISDNTNHRIVKFHLATGVMKSWIGWINSSPTGGEPGCIGAGVSTVTPGWCSGGTSKTGTVMGSLKNPRGLATDGTYLYVADTANHRIQRYILATGAIDSWIGRVSSNPTGGPAGCTTAGNNNFTPNWCVGGTSKSGTGNGAMNSPYGVAILGGDLYVADYTNNRINKYVLNNGSFVGWKGRALTVPSGGSAGCSSSVIGNATPGWCLGGTAQNGIDDGMFNGPASILTSSNFIYITDSLNHKIQQIDAISGANAGWLGVSSKSQSTWSIDSNPPNLSGRDDASFYGALGVTSDGTNLFVADGSNHRIKNYTKSAIGLDFVGWLGGVWMKPTGGGISCTGVALNATAPKWCPGGASKAGTSSGQFNVPNDLYVDDTHLFVVDRTNHRVQKFNKSTGAFVGWIGRINSSPTGGNPGCSGAAVNSFTPGWCSGGTSKTGAADGHMNSPQGIHGDSTFIYVVDSSNHRLLRFNKATGAFGGWIGRVLTVPTGGATGCTSVPIGSSTPGWCLGGTSQSGTGNGAMSTPIDATSDSVHLFVADSGNSRLLKFDLTTGAFVGWLGRISSSPTGGDPGCAGALNGTATPGFCTGGASQFGTGNGHFRTPRGLWTNGTFLYVVDGANHRIVKLTVDGTFVGWQGRVGSSPTAGDAGCAGAAVGTLTQGWCKGGTGSRGDKMGMFDTPMFLTGFDNSYLIVTQTNNSLLTRVPY